MKNLKVEQAQSLRVYLTEHFGEYVDFVADFRVRGDDEKSDPFNFRATTEWERTRAEVVTETEDLLKRLETPNSLWEHRERK